MQTAEVIERFKATGALLEGHFVLSSGLHSPNYLQCALVLQDPKEAEKFGREIAEHFRNERIEVVAAPAIGGIVIGHEVARAVGARFIWTEREEGKMTLRRGFSVSAGERTLVVEDVVTTGGSTLETVKALRDAGANVIGAASIIDRSAGKAEVGVRRIALATLAVPIVDAAVCEQCQRGEATTKLGSRKDSKA